MERITPMMRTIANGDEGERDVGQRQHAISAHPAEAGGAALMPPHRPSSSQRCVRRPAQPGPRPRSGRRTSPGCDRPATGSVGARPRPPAPATLVAALHQLAMDELDGADIDAARRLADQQHPRLALHLARQHQLLLVAAGKARRAQCRRAAGARRTAPSVGRNGRRPPVRRAGQFAAEGGSPRPGSTSPTPLEGRNHALTQAILRDVRETQAAHLAGSQGWLAIDPAAAAR